MLDDDTTFLYDLARNSEELQLIEYLTGAEKPMIRHRAAELLGGLTTGTSPEVQERITRALHRTAKADDSDAVRAAAIDALYLRNEDSLESLIDAVTEGDIDDTPAWMRTERVTDWLESDHAELRLIAAAALGRIGDRAATEPLVGVFDDPDVRVRARAVQSCGQLGDPRCVDALAARLTDGHDQVRREAAAALASIGTESALQALAPAARSDSEAVRRIALGELGRFETLEPLPLLLEGLDDSDELVRRTATRSLLELLANAPSDSSHDVRNEVASAVMSATPPDLVSQLLTILGGNQPDYIRRNATWLLGQVVDSETARLQDAQTTLVEALDDPDDITAKFAMSTLSELEGANLLVRLRRYAERDDISAAARSRAEFVCQKLEGSPSRTAVTNAVEVTYVSDPADYTAKKRERDIESADE
ncbi:HEAT repeat domain-containing protein [Salinadaptatus halalkaliphilus]|uniref:HEAT repeat domain-containing protein n=1 Tax=Salinadaptatus halalkaliphilus TaxID=2419781 RepID=A0A4S3TNI0_9EURY|nr:HEAT repeat domain-containing protein [Salinadaptatus halalkaliphilus]THE64783.1 HEAT repeat domain-containing protein [Salinadaptatus halalkaliphilus]